MRGNVIVKEVMVIQPPGMKSKIKNRGNQLLIEVPSQKIWFAMLFLPVWLIGWAMGEFTVGKSLLSGDGQGGLFSLVWITMWTFGGGFALLTLAWMLVGKEVITVDRDQFSVKKDVLGLGFKKIYLLNQIRELRVVPFALTQWNEMQFYGLGPGLIAFDYGSSTVRFASGIDEAEAKKLLDALLTYNATFAQAR